jgi:phosphoserine phosphatase RsbU/P
VRALIADDDRTTIVIVSHALQRCGLEVDIAYEGESAWRALSSPDGPRLAVLDWMMPSLDGLELCRRIRRDRPSANVYIILVTARESRTDVVAGLDAGADDYVVKPFDQEELRARVQVGMRVLALQASLATHVAEMQAALSQVKQLDGLLPICSYCKRIRSDQDYWQQMEQYLAQHSEARFSHGVCPECYEKIRRDFESA